MPVTTVPKKTMPPALQAMLDIGISQGDVTWLDQSGFQVKLLPNKFQFINPTKAKGPIIDEVDITVSQLLALHNSNLPAGEKAKLLSQLTNVMNILKSSPSIPHKQPGALDLLPAMMDPPAAVAKEAPPTHAPEAEVPIPGATATFDKSKMMSAATVPLANAKWLYQPVMGTSPGSRYFVVGMTKDLKIAAKFESGNLSIRVEGPGLHVHKTKLNEVGFDKTVAGKAYTSLHLQTQDNMLAVKAVGAILLGLGMDMTTPMPNMQHIPKG